MARPISRKGKMYQRQREIMESRYEGKEIDNTRLMVMSEQETESNLVELGKWKLMQEYRMQYYSIMNLIEEGIIGKEAADKLFIEINKNLSKDK